ncbi:hypothetical protein Slin15195_G024940 [Septoria linicola]|uniref:Uncharacterized protein n=1 Tax=Septoria linicola TaxID=215465 RepID=A0A9Q9AHH6_9PEZI|nr:hypothetical protein Slin14017_G024030 [Septoria linicola]USW49175.1 hypothetical protein Slin15195_G024940 [Septoria linicola]
MAFIGVYALPALAWPNKFQVGGPGDYDWGRQYYKPTHKWERYGWFPWLTFGLCLSSFLITLAENILSMFNKLSIRQLIRSEWTKAIMWSIWFLCISIMAAVKLRRGRVAGMDRYVASVVTINGENHVQVWPNYEPYPNGCNVLAALAWCFPFWFSLLIMRKHLQKGTFEQDPAGDGGQCHEPYGREDRGWFRAARGGYDGTHDSVEIVQPSQGSLEDRHPAFFSAK